MAASDHTRGGTHGRGSERRRVRLERLSGEGRDLASFRTEALRQVRSSVSVDAAFFATVDPVTLLFTSAVAESPLAQATPLFLDNEFGRQDVNKFARLAAAADPVGSLDLATGGDRADQPPLPRGAGSARPGRRGADGPDRR